MSSATSRPHGFLLASLLVTASCLGTVCGQEVLGRSEIHFEENRGQLDPRVAFVARGSKDTMLLARDGSAALCWSTPDGERSLWADPVGGEPTQPHGEGLTTSRVNHFRGRDPNGWVTDVPVYRAVRYPSVWPGIDLVWHGSRGGLEYDFELAPGADPAAVRLRFDGAEALDIDPQGDLVLRCGSRQIRHRAPVAWQADDRTAVVVSFVRTGEREIGFALGSRDPDQALVIDPTLAFATYLGGSSGELFMGLAVDAAEHPVVCGITASSDFPARGGVTSPRGTEDIFVTKLTPDGANIVFSTFLGGANRERDPDVAVRPNGDICVSGASQSSDYPITGGAFQQNTQCAVLSLLSASGNQLLYSTGFGGGSTLGTAVASDANGLLFLAGQSRDTLPTTTGVVQPNLNNPQRTDGFVAWFNPLLGGPPSLLAATYFGGSETDRIQDMAVRGGRVAVVGDTRSANLVTQGGVQQGFAGARDLFMAVFDVTLVQLQYGTYLGGSGTDGFVSGGRRFAGIAIDAAGVLHVTSGSNSTDFPTTGGAISSSLTGTDPDAIVARIDPTLQGAASLLYSTYLGGSKSDCGAAVAVDAFGETWVVGRSGSRDFPMRHELQTLATLGAVVRPFVALIDGAGALRFSTGLGDPATAGSTLGQGIAALASGGVLVAGETSEQTLPTTAGAFQTAIAGSGDGFVVRIDVTRAAATVYGTGHPGSIGAPALSATAPVLGSTSVLSLGNSRGSSTAGALFVGVSPTSLASPFGGTLLVLPITSLPVTLPASGFQLPLSIPASPSLGGVSVFFQGAELDPGASQGLSLSAGLDLLFGI